MSFSIQDYLEYSNVKFQFFLYLSLILRFEITSNGKVVNYIVVYLLNIYNFHFGHFWIQHSDISIVHNS